MVALATSIFLVRARVRTHINNKVTPKFPKDICRRLVGFGILKYIVKGFFFTAVIKDKKSCIKAAPVCQLFIFPTGKKTVDKRKLIRYTISIRNGMVRFSLVTKTSFSSF